MQTSRILTFLVALWLAVATGGLVWGTPPQPGADRIFFSKSFPGSNPGYFEVTVDSAGQAAYREDPEEEPLEFHLSEKETHEVFELAKILDRFQSPLQSDRKVAFTGKKTLRYSTASGEETEVEFSYTENKDAQAIVVWFESAGETERHRTHLERVVQFDRLGVNKALLLFQSSFDDDRVVGAQQFLPVLRTIVEDSKFMHQDRSRAASLIERIERVSR